MIVFTRFVNHLGGYRHLRLAALAYLAGLGTVVAQLTPSTTQNYVLEQAPRTAQSNVSLSSPYASVPATISYLDGLGRPLQQVQVRGAGDATKDVIGQATTYDAYARPQKQYLPVPATTGGGGWQADVQTAGAAFYGDSYPYTESVYEASPLNRVVQQAGVGQNWRTANRTARMNYGVTSGILRFKVSFQAVYANVEGQMNYEYFGPHDIATRVSTNEQTNKTIDYIDLQGRTIRRDVVLAAGDTLTTAYAYDNYERLAAVIPPKLYKWFRAGNTVLYFQTASADNPIFKDLAFVTIHDKRSRPKTKHVPGMGWTELVYDQLDRVVMSQDQQDKTEGKWRFTRYDGLGRPVLTGRLTLSRAAEDLRADFAAQTTTAEERGTALGGYTNQSFPATVPVAETDLLTVTYYDTYGFGSLTFQSAGSYAVAYPTATGLVTGGKVRNLTTNDWYESAQWYDDKGRVIQSQRQNHLGGVDRSDNQFQFNGELLAERTIHTNATAPTRTRLSEYQYDHQGRPTTYALTLDATPKRTLATYSYDGLGRLSQKQWLGVTSNPGVCLTLKGFIGGALSGPAPMADQLRVLNLVPLKEPYSAAPYSTGTFVHVGGGGETTSSAILAQSGSQAVVDWIFIELRSTPTTVVATRSALLRRDGSVTDTDGSACINFANVPPGGYYVTFRHRNHLGVMTAQPVSFSTNTASVDFSTVTTATYRNSTSAVDVPQLNDNGLLSLWRGNAGLATTGAAQSIIFQGPNNDVTFIYSRVTNDPGNVTQSAYYKVRGYENTDVNLDGQAIYQGPGNDVDYINNTVQGHPGNVFNSASFTVKEQLPIPVAYTSFSAGSASPLQTMTYHYHPRGWLKGLNLDTQGNPSLTGGKLFAFRLGYEEDGTYYDGNIRSQRWVNARDNTERSYTYGYDAASRLLSGQYVGKAGENYSLAGMSYDPNGNILSLQRPGQDQLTYSYGPGNSLTAVSDAIVGNADVGDFRDGNTTGADYAYWADGSLKQDLNRGISNIQYNLLKLPRQITLTNGKVISYQYDASGRKLKMTIANLDTRDYAGDYQYLNRSLVEVSHAEGRAVAQGIGYQYEYFYKDHLGNVRTAVKDSAGVAKAAQYTDYDPWGLELRGLGSSSSTNRFKFNEKESLTELGSGLLDYGARFYDATIGRWGVVDPLAELDRRWSPYRYGYDNPVRMIDPDGMFEYSNGYTTEDSRYTTGSVQFEGTYQNNGGDGPTKPKPTANSRPESGRNLTNAATQGPQGQAAVGAMGTATTLGRTAANSILGRIISGIGRLLTTGVGVVASLPFLVESDTRTTDESVKDPLIFYHYTNESGLAGILATQRILPNQKGKVYITHTAMSPADVFQNIFLNTPTHSGRGDYIVVFKLRPDQAAQLQTTDLYELVYPNGTLKLPEILYGGPNTIPNK